MPVSTETWVDLAKLIFIPGGVAVTLLTMVRGWNKGPSGKPVEATVVSAALADGAAVRDLIEELGRHRRALCDTADRAHRDSEQERDATDELAREVRQWREDRRNDAAVPPPWALELLARVEGRKA